MNATWIRGAAVVIWLALAAGFVPATAGQVETVNVSVTVPTLQRLDLSTHAVSFAAITSHEYDVGYVAEPAALTVTVSSNTAWKLSVRTTSANMGTVCGYAKPASDLQWRKSGGAYAAITGADQVIESSTIHAAGHAVSVDVRMMLNWARDIPGRYGLDLTFTLAESVEP